MDQLIYSIPDNDPDLIGLTFVGIKPMFVRCNKKQRETLEYLARVKGIGYRGLVKKCGEISGRQIRGIGELSKGEAIKVIMIMGGKE